MLCRVLIWTTGRAALQWQEPSETAQTGQHVHRGTVSVQYCELISVYVKDAILWAHFSLCVRCNTVSSFQSMWKMQYCELISVYVKDAILWAHFSLCERCNTVSSFQSMWKMQYCELISVYVKDALVKRYSEHLFVDFEVLGRCQMDQTFFASLH